MPDLPRSGARRLGGSRGQARRGGVPGPRPQRPHARLSACAVHRSRAAFLPAPRGASAAHLAAPRGPRLRLPRSAGVRLGNCPAGPPLPARTPPGVRPGRRSLPWQRSSAPRRSGWGGQSLWEMEPTREPRVLGSVVLRARLGFWSGKGDSPGRVFSGSA